jgi:hypothetical protein
VAIWHSWGCVGIVHWAVVKEEKAVKVFGE